MNDIAGKRASFADQAVIFKRKHNWMMCWLYTGTFGSFIGYSAGSRCSRRCSSPTSIRCKLVFLGPLVGALSRSATGWLSDRYGRRPRHVLGLRPDDPGGSRRPLLPRHQGSAGRLLGLLRNVHGAVLRDGRRQRVDVPDDPRDHAHGNAPARAQPRRVPARQKQAEMESAAIIGFTSAVAAYGAFFIPKAYGTSIALTGGTADGAVVLHSVLRQFASWSPGPSTPGAAVCCTTSNAAVRCRPRRNRQNEGNSTMSHFLDRLTFFTRDRRDLLRRPRRRDQRRPHAGRTATASAGSTTRSCAPPMA